MCVSWPPVAQWPTYFLSTTFQESNDLGSFMRGPRDSSQELQCIWRWFWPAVSWYVLWIVTKKARIWVGVIGSSTHIYLLRLWWNHQKDYLPKIPILNLVRFSSPSWGGGNGVHHGIPFKWEIQWWSIKFVGANYSDKPKWQTPFVTKLDECYDWNCY